MRITIERCAHCRTTYRFQASGEGIRSDNHKDYCPDCWGTVKRALMNVPVRFRFEFIPQLEVTLDQMERWEEEWEEEYKKNSLLPIGRRVLASMYDPETKEHSRYSIVKGRGEHAGKVFNCCYWPSRRNEAIIGIGVETNMMTGELRPCEEFHNR